MNILYLTPYPPVLHMHGGGVRMFHNIRILAQEHQVHVISFFENEEERELLKSVEPVCESITGIQRISDFGPHWFSLKPFLVHEFGTPAMYVAVDDAIRRKKIDVIQCEYLHMAQYRRPGIFSILTEMDVMSANGYQAFQDPAAPIGRFRLFSRWMATLNYEISMCNRFDRVVAMTKEDARYLRSYARHANIRDIPIGIDPNYFQPSWEPDHPIEVVFIGNYRHTPNVEAAEFLMKEVVPYFPKIRFVIAGSYLPENLGKLSQFANVTLPGYVPDTRSLFHAPHTIFAAPLFSGTGQRVKLLEAFAMQCPVVTTAVGAAGFPIQSGNQAVIAATAPEFRAAIQAFVSSAELRAQTGRAARKMIEDDFSWDTIGQRFLELVSELVV